MDMEVKTKLIRKLNDDLRKSFIGGRVMITRTVAALEPEIVTLILLEVRSFDNFNEDNDPYGEHDFVSVEVGGEKFFAKIDYYDKNLEFGSEEPWNPAVTSRVMTIMHSSDY